MYHFTTTGGLDLGDSGEKQQRSPGASHRYAGPLRRGSDTGHLLMIGGERAPRPCPGGYSEPWPASGASQTRTPAGTHVAERCPGHIASERRPRPGAPSSAALPLALAGDGSTTVPSASPARARAVLEGAWPLDRSPTSNRGATPAASSAGAAAGAPPAPDGAAPRLRRLAHDRAALAVVAMMAVYAGAFAWLSVARHRSFSTGRFDLGNMVQALWNTAHGRFFETTDVSGVQFNRLGAHVNLVLAMFTPLWWAWPSPEMLLVAQAVIVAAGALPAFWLGRRWLQDDRLAVAFAGVYLLFPALQHATLFDFHPVTLAAPLLMYCIWAAEERHYVVLGICAALACLTQEQVGLVVAGLAVWMWFRHPDRRRAATILAAGSIAWVVVAIGVIMPAFAIDGSNPHITRYSNLGDSPSEILTTFVTRPWDAFGVVVTPGRFVYLAALLLPLLLLPLAAPLLALAALPQLLINLFASSGPVQSVQYHYAVLLVPFLVAAAMLGLARLMEREAGAARRRSSPAPGWWRACWWRPSCWRGRQGPLPIGGGCPAAGRAARCTPSPATIRRRRSSARSTSSRRTRASRP